MSRWQKWHNKENRAVDTHDPPRHAPREDLPASSGLATAGYRSAKYTPEEWLANNYTLLNRAVAERSAAENICHLSKNLHTETEAGTQRTQADGTRHLGERLQDIHLWKSELEQHIDKLEAETGLLLKEKGRLERALNATEIPFSIATDNLTCRERRLGPDLVKDCVEDELLKEVELVKSVQALLRKTLDQATSQVKTNREVKQMLELDWSDKFHAYTLDSLCGRYKSTSTNTQHYPSSAKLQEQVSNCESWASFTRLNLAESARAMQGSVGLRQLVQQVLQETGEDMRAQSCSVEQAFSQRCSQLTEAKVQLENHLTQTLQQIGAQEKNLASLQQALYDKEAPLRVAQSRLHQRANRPNMELCRDPPQLSLVNEVDEITNTKSALQQQLCDARHSLAALEETRMALEKDIACKTHSLFIDREKCMRHRTRYPSLLTLTGY
ncbi:tektin-4 isoform X2 [Denticeps clupeoides]|uniref:tektin-4 isoform X2 n=1 Tax=Denticeps clupeoides TaxID=299321 RepID=UPI0010A376CB|nr:tektin-4 isoform X2 [Denticeps clupeoides]